MLSLMGGHGSDIYRQFEDLVVKGFLVARSVCDMVISVVGALADSGVPCFMHKEDNINKLRERFLPAMSTTESAKFIRLKIADAAGKWTTKAYDRLQRLQNNVH